MKDPGPIKAGSEDHRSSLEYAKAISKRFDMALPAAYGHVLRFDEVIRMATKSPIGMSALVLECKPDSDTDNEPVSERKVEK